jgi:negative regulator of flagellin synthesis FlgM
MDVSNSVNAAKIANPSAGPSVGAVTSAGAAGPSGTRATVPASVPAVDQTTISAASGLFSSALSGSDVRMERVTALQSAIQSGTYQVPASAVADKMLTALGA